MRPLARQLYEAAGQLARAVAELAPDGSSKVGRSLQARKGIRQRYASWAGRSRDPRRPLLWMHAPSVGEGLQARPVLELLRAERPDLQIAYTHFSPSAATFAASLGADFHDFLPFDTAADATAALDALKPDVLVFSKLDVWPTLAIESARRGVRLGLVSATVSTGSGRQHGVVRWMLEPAYAALDAVGAISAEDAERLVAIGVRREVVSVTGDTRYDQVWARAQGVDRSSPLIAGLASDRPTVVAGSTWPADEAPLLSAWGDLRAPSTTPRLIIAPHEPTPEHLAAIEGLTTYGKWEPTTTRFSSAAARNSDIVIVDRVGVLGDLYALASAAYVGGGFHAAGLHSVLEPAAFGVPVLFGPRYTNSRDAGKLIACGGGASARNAGEIAAYLERWLSDPASRRAAGDKAREMVREGLGAARRSADLVLALLDAKRR